MTNLQNTSILQDSPYYRWWYGIEKAGVPRQAVTEYYRNHDPDNILTLEFDDETFEYPILTRDNWVWGADTPFDFIFDDTEVQTDYQWYYITSAVSRMSYASDRVSIETVEELEDYVWNGELYTVNQVTDDSVDLIQSDFYSVLSSAEPYIAELNSFLYNSNVSRATTEEDVRSIVRQSDFPIRDSNAQTLSQIIEASSETEFPIGGTYPVILRTEDGYECIVSQRSTEVQSWPEYWTVIPAGYFSPDGIDNRLGVLNQFYTEYCEELFGAVEGSVDSHNDRVQQVELQMADGDAEFAVTGLGVEGVGLSFEISGVFIVNDVENATEIKGALDSNYEVESLQFMNLNDVEMVRDFLTPDDVTPPSAFALINALQYLNESLPPEDQPESVKLIE